MSFRISARQLGRLTLMVVAIAAVSASLLSAGSPPSEAIVERPHAASSIKIDAADSQPSTRSNSNQPAAVRRQVRALERREKRRARWLRSDEARLERKRSTTRYAQLKSASALSIARREQPKVVVEPVWTPPRPEKGEKIVGYASATTARVAGDGTARKSEVDSTLVHSLGYPMAVSTGEGERFEPIDLSLSANDSDGSWKPARSSVPTSIPASSDSAVRIGDDESGQTISVRMADTQSRGVVTSGTKVFFPNTDVDTDAIVEPTPLGASFSWILRSQNSPSAQKLEFDLPSRTSIRMVSDGSAEIVIGDTPIANVSRPVAFDAQGQSVTTRFRQIEDTLVVEVDHVGGDFAYPIAVDPVVDYSGLTLLAQYAGQTPAESVFGFGSTDGNRLIGFTNTNAYGSARHNIETRGTLGAATAAFVFDPVRNSTVTKIDWNNVIKSSSGLTLTAGIADSAGTYLPNQLSWYSGSGPYVGAFGNGSFYTIPSGIPVSNCAEGGCVSNQADHTNARFQIITGSTAAAYSHAEFLGAYVYVKDNANPSIQSITGMPSPAWRQANSVSPTVSVYDAGVGVGNPEYGYGTMGGAAVELQIDDLINKYLIGPACTGDPYSTCPDSYQGTYSGDKTVSLKGERQVSVRSSDILGRRSPAQTFTVRNDVAGPEIAIGGRFGALAVGSLNTPRTMSTDTDFVITATDGSTSGPDLRESGVQSISARFYRPKSANPNEVDVNAPVGAPFVSTEVNPCESSNDPSVNSCPEKLVGAFEAESLDPGVYFLRASATDLVGRTSTRDFKIAVGIAEIASVTEGQATSRYLPLQIKQSRRADGSALPENAATDARLQWRPNKMAGWQNLERDWVLRETTGSPLTDWPINLQNGLSERWVVDLDAMRTALGQRIPDGEVLFRALIDGAENELTRSSEDVTVRYDRGGKDTNDDTASLGPGSVDMVTGNLSVSATDVGVDAFKTPLSVSRTYNSQYTRDDKSVLGPGWVLSQPAESAGSDYASLMDNSDAGLDPAERNPYVEITDSSGSIISFELDAVSGVYRGELGFESLSLKRQSDPNVPTNTVSFTLTDRDARSMTTFERPSAAAPIGQFVPVRIQEIDIDPNAAATTKLAYQFTAGKAYLDTAFADPPSIECSTSWSTIERGCSALKYSYADVPVAAPNQFRKRLTGIKLRTYAPELAGNPNATCDSSGPTAGMCEIQVASYTYDAAGRLYQAWDPRLPELKTTYNYTVADLPGDGTLPEHLLATVTPPGELPHTIAYENLTEDQSSGRVKSISRSALADGTATWSLRYYVPTHGLGAPFDFSQSQTSQWGQENGPYMAAAVFPPDQQPSSNPPSAEDYDRASISYLDPLGREVNAREPGDRTNVTEYSKYGEVTRTLSAGNRALALEHPDHVAESEKLDTQHTYAPVPGTFEGRRHLVKTIGPEHSVRLKTGATRRARQQTTLSYDEGSPIAGDNTKEPFDLVTTTEVTALADGKTIAGETRTTKTSYGANEAEWKLRQARETTTDPGDGRLNIKRRLTIDGDGLVTERFQPNSQDSSAPSTTRIIYYTAGANAQDPENCGGKPEWVGLPCKTGPGVQPDSAAGMPGLPVQTFTYNYLRQPLRAHESVTNASGGTDTRTSTKTFDIAGRVITESVTGSIGAPVKATEHVYDQFTGRELKTISKNSDYGEFQKVTRTFDALGRQTGYTDGSGHVSTTSYDLLNRVATKHDGRVTRTYTYDAVTGELVTVLDPAAGYINATYDDDGRMRTSSLPGGIVKSVGYDETGAPVALTYTKSTGCSSACSLLSNSAIENIHGQTTYTTGNLDQNNRSFIQIYKYDNAGRLIRAENRRNNGSWTCETRDYELDANSNRTKLRTTPIAVSCSSGPSTVKNSTYDAADRITNPGYTYDAFGRITTVPKADAGGSSDLKAKYFVNDLAKSIQQDGLTQRIELDPLGRIGSKLKFGTQSAHESYAYTDDSDAPAWIANIWALPTSPSWTRFIEGIGGDTEATTDQSGAVKVMINNLRGDTVAEVSNGQIQAIAEVDEFGVVKGGQPASRRYGFHGSKQREVLTAGGTIAMGVRLYVPGTGRFLQVDPVVGGTESPYAYPSDPVNSLDLDGRRYAFPRPRPCGYIQRYCDKASRAIKRAARFVYRNVCLHYGATTKLYQKVIKEAGKWVKRTFRYTTVACLAWDYRRALVYY